MNPRNIHQIEELPTYSSEDVPEGWAKCPIRIIAKKITKGATPTSYGFKYQNEGIKFIKVENLNDGIINCDSIRHFISEEANRNQSRSILQEGDILYSIAGTIGKTCLVRKEDLPANTNQALAIIRGTSDVLLPSLLQLQLRSEISHRQITNQARGGSMNNISLGDVSNIQIYVPPLDEQKRIVAKVEELLERVNVVRERLARVKEILKHFRQSVLSAACSGRLTKDWREKHPEIEPASELLKRIRGERTIRYNEKYARAKVERTKKIKKDYEFSIVTETSSIPGWAEAKLENLIYIAGRIGWRGLKAEEYTDKGPLFLSVHSLNYGEEVDFRDALHISKERYDESPEIQLKENDILLAKDGAGIGKIGIIRSLNQPATVNSSLLLIRSLEAFVPKYLFYFLSGPDLQKIVKERITGSATPHLFQKDIKKFKLSIPPLEEQDEIVRRIEIMFKLADEIEKRVAVASEKAENLIKAILANAFLGELVTTEAELARRESRSYEQASVLLAKILHQ